MPDRPELRRQPNGQLTKKCTQEAMDYKKAVKTKTVRSFMEVHSEARKAVQLKGGNTENDEEVLCEYRIQFGQYKGQSFKWLMENDLFYVVYVAASSTLPGEVEKQKNESSDKIKNRMALTKYASYFSEVQTAIERKRETLLREQKTPTPTQTKPALSSSLAARLASGSVTPERFVAKYKSATCTTTVRPNLPTVPKTQTSSATTTATSTQVKADARDDDQELCLLAEQIEENLVQSVDQPKPKETENKSTQTPKAADSDTSDTAQASNYTTEDCPLFDGWRQTLPKADHLWISKALFKRNSKGKAELDYSRVKNKLWWYPPSASPNVFPRPDYYFARRLLLWMPRKMWRVRLVCPHDGCDNKELTSAGIYLKVRQVTDVDGYYNLASEYLECKNCKRKVISWSPPIVSQLTLGQQVQFPVLLTYQYACDVRVIRLLRQRGLGNSSTQLEKKLLEQHSEKWVDQSLNYLTVCKYFTEAQKKGLVNIPAIIEPPKFIQPPKAAWLLTVYAQDVLKRMDHIKAAITSTFGRILKLDSTKKIVRKLAGKSAGTAAWCTNVGNETGQVLMSVLTASEGAGLDPMATGLMRRYALAGVTPPEVLYVDRDCCGNKMQEMFSLWDGIVVRLDIWHFMRRMASGCTTEAHQLYGYFCGRLSRCIFQWSQQDLDLLKLAKRCEMLKSGIINPTDDDVIKKITKKELALHCRRQTRGVEETERLLYNLLETLSGEQGCDTMGVPLLDSDRIWEIWESQKRHIPCLQDPEGVQLYTRTGTLEKGDVLLPTYRCARGTTSLESFHKHIARFIPGESASDMHFQAYLLDGLMRWNADRAVDAVYHDCRPKDNPETYNALHTKALNTLSQEVLGKKLRENVLEVGIYTGEQIGVEYLYGQTGKVLKDNYLENEEEGSQQPEPLSTPNLEDDEGFDEVEDETLENAADVYLTSDDEKASEDDSDDSHSAEDAAEELSREAEDFAGPGNVQGYGQVQALAEYLVSLRGSDTMAISNSQAKDVVRMWNKLDAYDKKPTKFAPRHRTKLTKGKFKQPKKRSSIVIPGLDSTRRSFLGTNSSPAQWPDCNRYVEAIIIKLCDIHPVPEKSKKTVTSRWNLICQSYKDIRRKILNNTTIMRETNIQLFEINHATLSQWYYQREKREERAVLEQGIQLLHAPSATNTQLPAPTVLPESVPEVQFPLPFTFNLPQNTSGMGRGKRLPSVTLSPPTLPQPVRTQPNLSPSQPINILPKPPTVCLSVQPQPGTSGIQTQQQPSLFLTPQQPSLAEPVPKRKRKAVIYVCSACGEPRDRSTHKFYYGKYFCTKTATQSYEDWIEQVKSTKRQKK